MPTDQAHHALFDALSAAVPLEIMRLRDAGPQQREALAADLRYPQIRAEKKTPEYRAERERLSALPWGGYLLGGADGMLFGGRGDLPQAPGDHREPRTAAGPRQGREARAVVRSLRAAPPGGVRAVTASPLVRDLMALAGVHRPDWNQGRLANAVVAAESAGWPEKRVFLYLARLIVTPDGDPADLLHEAGLAASRANAKAGHMTSELRQLALGNAAAHAEEIRKAEGRDPAA